MAQTRGLLLDDRGLIRAVQYEYLYEDARKTCESCCSAGPLPAKRMAMLPIALGGLIGCQRSGTDVAQCVDPRSSKVGL